MYDEHVPLIAAAMNSSPEYFVKGCLFAICSIQQPITSVPDQLRDIAEMEDGAVWLFGWKVDGYRYLRDHGADLHRDVIAEPNLVRAIEILAQCPGLGIVKAGFVLQLMGRDIACLDGRNLQREGRDVHEWQVNKGTLRWRRRVRDYVAEVGGKARHYWDAWCNHVSTGYGITGEEISALHLAIIN